MKMGQMHMVTHLAFFITIWTKIDYSKFHPTGENNTADYEQQIMAVKLLKWGHLAMFINQLAVLYLKRYGHHEWASILSVCVGIPAWYYPLINALYAYKTYNFKETIPGLAHDDHVETETAMWIVIELVYFFSWIISLIVFLFFTQCVQYKSVRKKNYDSQSKMMTTDKDNQHQLDIWSGIESDDFLRYLKWEAYTFGFYLTGLFQLGNIWWKSNEFYSGHKAGTFPNTKSIIILGLLMGWRFFQICFTFRLLMLGTEIDRPTLICRKYGKWVLQLAIYIPVILLWLQNDDSLEHNDIADLWFQVEIVQILAEPFFF